jgi:glycosyltransferase involved in cell wall biosynthesis
MSGPEVTILMPVYNAERYVVKAVESILNQTFQDFEFLIINDGSTDQSLELIKDFGDPRIRVINTENQGVAAALHLGMEMARGAYIARMDADDECLPNRLEIEKRCLDEHDDIAVVHGSLEYIDSEGSPIFMQKDEGHSNVLTKWLLNWRNVLIHSTVMLRASVLKENNLNYRIEMNRAEDFDLWNRVARISDLMYLPDVLIRYRVHSENVSNSTPIDLQFNAQSRVLQENFHRYGVELTLEIAQELVVISGAARINPITYIYENLNGRLHCIAAVLLNKFCVAHTVEKNELDRTQADQYLRWARYMLNTSRSYTIRLLFVSLCKRKRAVFSYLFWAVMGGLLLPKKCN